MASDETTGLFGWGYEGRSVDDLVTYTRRHGAQAVVDVRLNAISRKRGFSKRVLNEHLAAAGLAYLHLPALGNPVDNRAGFAVPGSVQAAAAHRRFQDQVLQTPGADEALSVIRRRLAAGPVVLLCFEADHRCCHRSLIVEALHRAPAMV